MLLFPLLWSLELLGAATASATVRRFAANAVSVTSAFIAAAVGAGATRCSNCCCYCIFAANAVSVTSAVIAAAVGTGATRVLLERADTTMRGVCGPMNGR